MIICYFISLFITNLRLCWNYFCNRMAPLALEAVYADQECDCQRVALSQGWTSVYINSTSSPEQPAYALFTKDIVGNEGNNNIGTRTNTSTSIKSNASTSSGSTRGEIVLAIRGTQTIQDIVTDIRTAPQRIPPDPIDIDCAFTGKYRRMRARTDTFTVNAEEDVCGARVSGADGDLGEDYLTLKLSQWEWSPSMGNMAYGCTGE